MSGLFNLARCSPGSWTLLQIAGFPSFLWLNHKPIRTHKDKSHFLYFFINRHVGSLHALALMNNVGMNVER